MGHLEIGGHNMAFGISKLDMQKFYDLRDELNDLAEKVYAGSSDLLSLVEEARGEYEERSERWQEGDRASEVSEWIDNMETLAGELEELSDALTEKATELDELQPKP
jgi:uncharacterized protein YukE